MEQVGFVGNAPHLEVGVSGEHIAESHVANDAARIFKASVIEVIKADEDVQNILCVVNISHVLLGAGQVFYQKGEHDAVYYECANDEFEAYITSKGFVTDWGSFSDISVVAPELGVAAVNLSSGYYNAHTLHEYINRNHLNATIERVLEIVADAAAEDFPKYEYVDSWDADFDTGYRWAGHGGGDWKSFLRREYSGYLKDVPKEIRDEYEELLDFYTASELDALREEHGDNIIHNLYRSEFGYSSDEYEMWMSNPPDERAAAPLRNALRGVVG